MITELTPEQEALLPVYRDKYLKIGLSTEPLDFETAKQGAILAYQAADLKPPGYFFHFPSPYAAARGVAALEYMWDGPDGLKAEIDARRAATIQPLLDRLQVLKDQIVTDGSAVLTYAPEISAIAQLRTLLDTEGTAAAKAMRPVEITMEELQPRIDAQIAKLPKKELSERALSQLYGFTYGAHDAGWLGFFAYVGEVLGLDITTLKGLFMLADSCGWWSPLDEIAVFQDRPSQIHLTDGVLHKDGGPAVEYRDGFAVYALHGIRVPDWLAVTPAEQIDPKRLLELTNQEIQREFVRKVGIERIATTLCAKDEAGNVMPVDSEDIDVMSNGQNVRVHYELWILEVGENEEDKLPYLYMQNPSVAEVWHLEGVDPACHTVREALAWRNGLTEDMIDDEAGADWYQQGDVIMRPKGATKFKALPIQLT
jgi:hypothetical protein